MTIELDRKSCFSMEHVCPAFENRQKCFSALFQALQKLESGYESKDLAAFKETIREGNTFSTFDENAVLWYSAFTGKPAYLLFRNYLVLLLQSSPYKKEKTQELFDAVIEEFNCASRGGFFYDGSRTRMPSSEAATNT